MACKDEIIDLIIKTNTIHRNLLCVLYRVYRVNDFSLENDGLQVSRLNQFLVPPLPFINRCCIIFLQKRKEMDNICTVPNY